MAIYRNERFLFDDPFDKCAINRTTRYRLKRKRCEGHGSPEHDSTKSSSGRQSEEIQSYEDEDLYLPADDQQDHEGDCISTFNTDADTCNDDCYYVQDDGNALMQYPELEYDFEPPPQDLSDDEPESPNDEQSQNTAAEEVLYDGCPLSVATSAILVMKFKAKHKLSNEGLQDLLNIIKLHCPILNKCIASSYLFNKQFGKNPGVSHYFCNSCFQSVDLDAQVCPNELCNSNLSDSRSSFTEVPIIPQLKRLLERELQLLTIPDLGTCC